MNGKFLNDKRLPGYRIKASEWNELNRRVGAMSMLPAVGSYRASLTNGLGMLTHNPIPLHLLLVELDEDLGPEATPAVPVSGPSGSASRAAAETELPEDDFRDQQATVLFFDPDDGIWKRNESYQVFVVTDPYEGLVWDKGARLLVMPYDQAGRYIPVPQVTFRQVRTKAGSPGNYPTAATNPNTYPIEFINNSYPATVGKQTLATSVKASSLDTAPGDAVPHNVVFNLNENFYIEEDSIIPAWFLFGQWWTFVGAPPSPTSTVDPCCDLCAWWKADEMSGNLIDSTPNKIDLVDQGAIGSASGLIVGSRVFGGSSSDYALRNHKDCLSIQDSGAIAGWMKPGALPTVLTTLFAKKPGGPLTNNGEWALFYGPPSGVAQAILGHFTHPTLGSQTIILLEATAGVDLFDGAFHFIALNVENINATTSQVSITIDNFTGPTSLITFERKKNGQKFSAGALSDGTSLYVGELDEWGLWARHLTPGEIVFLFNKGMGRTFPFGDPCCLGKVHSDPRAEDRYSYDDVVEGETARVPESRQMAVAGPINISGCLEIQGTLRLT